MGLFGNANDVTIIDEVETATNEKSLEEDWSKIISICDKAGKNTDDAKSYLRAIVKRLYNSDPHVGIKAVTLLDACVKNSGKTFHIEVASREFETDFTKLMQKAPKTVAKKLRESLKRWSENEFKTDGQLNLVPSLYTKLKNTGYDFSSSDTPQKKSVPVSKDPNVVESQEEEEQILKAIELSLKDSSTSPKVKASSYYPSISNMSDTASSAPVAAAAAAPPKEMRKVRALYDFEAVEDNELTFTTGEIIFVIDDSDTNWWKGTNQHGEGLFPANFVTTDLSVEPEKFLFEKAKKNVQFKETTDVKEDVEDVEINEVKIDRLLHLLHEADPTNPERDTDEMLKLEREVNGMGPLIDSELERVDRKHAQLTKLSSDLVEAFGLYHSLMREPTYPPPTKFGYPPPPSPMVYNGGSLPHNMQQHHPSMMPPMGMQLVQERQPFMPSSIPHQPSHQHYATMQPPPGGHMVPQPSMGPPHMHTQDDNRPPMGHFPGMPNFIPGVHPHQFPPNLAAGPPGIPNGPSIQQQQQQQQQQQPPHFVSSSTHIMH